jgi:DNA primase large subunit
MFESGKLLRGINVIDYPFLIKDPIEFLNMRGEIPPSTNLLEAVEVLGAGERVLEIIKDAVEKGLYRRGRNSVTDLVAFHASLLVLNSLGEKWVLKRLSVSIAKHYSSQLYRLDDDSLVVLAGLLGLHVKKHFGREVLKIPLRLTGRGVLHKLFPISIRLRDYIKWSYRLKGDPAWKITNQPILDGKVFIDRRKLIRLMEEAIDSSVETLSKEYENAVKPGQRLPGILGEVSEKAKKIIEKNMQKTRFPLLMGEYRGPINYDAFPPCMKNILLRAKSGANLSHHERFAIATFLIQLGADEETVIDVFRNSPDFKEKIARYQVEHLMGKRGGGKKYKPYNCDTMKTLGLCVAECNVKTPFQKYLQNLRETRKSEKKKESNPV